MKRPPVVFNWIIDDICNYRCPYCFYDGHWESSAEEFKRMKRPDYSRLTALWKEIHDKYGASVFTFAGGEPTIYPRFFDLLLELSRWHYWTVCTNLSGPIERWENLLRQIDTSKACVGVSFHPYETSLDAFVQKTARLKRAIRNVTVAIVAYPPVVRSLPEYQQRFCDVGLPWVEVMPYQGLYNGRQYPDAYTAEERALVFGVNKTAYVEKLEYAIQNRSPKGRLCDSGAVYCQINAAGDVFRCSHAKNVKLGNLFTSFELNAGPSPCPAEACDCEMVWLRDEEPARNKTFPFNMLSEERAETAV